MHICTYLTCYSRLGEHEWLTIWKRLGSIPQFGLPVYTYVSYKITLYVLYSSQSWSQI